jgi:hypothetical protein
VGEGGSFGEVLSDEAIGVFVGATFPGVARGGEVEGGAEFFFYVFVAVEFGTVIRCDGMDSVRF